MRFRKGILTLHKEINEGKYNKFTPSKESPDMNKEYIKRPDDWRRRSK